MICKLHGSGNCSRQSAPYTREATASASPGYAGQCIKVCFPLPNGRAIVIMRPDVHPDGSLTVVSDGRAFGDPGFYFVVEHNGATWARYVQTMEETIHVYPAEAGVVRADHILRIWGRIFLRLHYRMAANETKQPSTSRGESQAS